MRITWEKKFLAELRRVGKVYLAAQLAGVSRAQVYYHRRRSTAFRSAWDRALREHLTRAA